MRICLSLTGCNLITKLRMKRYAMIHLALCVICTYNGYKKYWHVPSFPNEAFFSIKLHVLFLLYRISGRAKVLLNDTKFGIFIYFEYLRYLLINTCVDTFCASYVRKNMFNFLNSESNKKDLLWAERKTIKLFQAVASNIGTLHRFLCIYRKFKGAKHTECT